MICLKENNIQIPDEFGISGYVNEPFGEFIDPPLTTTEQFGADIGKESARALISLIQKPEQPVIQHITNLPKLIIRNSTLKNY